MDIIAAIDEATGCQQCGEALGSSPSGDFCGEGCQRTWYGSRAVGVLDADQTSIRTVGAKFSAAAKGTDFTLYKPSGLEDGVLMLAFLTAETGRQLTPPSGWTLMSATSAWDRGGGTSYCWVLWKYSRTSDPSCWVAAVNTAVAQRVAMVAVPNGPVRSDYRMPTGART